MWSQPAFWLLLLPLLAAAVLWPAARWPRAQAGAGAGLALLLALWLRSLDLPSEGAIWLVYGRSFILTSALQMLFVLLTLYVALLALLNWPLSAGPRFVPVTLALLTPAAALVMIRPFIFAAPFWFLLVVVVLLLFRYEDDSGITAVQVALRYWLLMLVATLLLLLAGWMLGGDQAALLLPGARLLALALGIILAGFPFFIWVRPLVTAVPLLALPVLLGLLPLLGLVLVIQLLLAYPPLGQTDAFLLWLPWSAGLTVLLAGFLTLTAVANWRQLVGSLVLLDMGFGLLSVALAGVNGWETAVVHHGLRLVSLLLVAGGYSVISKQYLVKWAGWLWAYGLMSLLGLPLTPGFSGRWAVLVDLGQSEVAAWPLALLLVAGMGLALLGLVRQMGHVWSDWWGDEETAVLRPAWVNGLLWAVLLFALLVAAIPQLLVAPLSQLATLF